MAKQEVQKKKSMTKAELEQTLLDNFINLQKVLTNLSLKFEELSTNIEKLLQLFEISAKSFAEKISKDGGESGDKELIEKLDALLNQNKTISKGIMLMEERMRNRNMPSQTRESESRFKEMSKTRPLPRY